LTTTQLGGDQEPTSGKGGETLRLRSGQAPSTASSTSLGASAKRAGYGAPPFQYHQESAESKRTPTTVWTGA